MIGTVQTTTATAYRPTRRGERREWVEVFIDDRSYGLSPLTTNLAPGTHTYRVTVAGKVETGSFKVVSGGFSKRK